MCCVCLFSYGIYCWRMEVFVGILCGWGGDVLEVWFGNVMMVCVIC